MKNLAFLFIIILNTSNLFAQIRFGKSTSTVNIDYSNPKEYELAGIDVVGVKYLDANALISLSDLKIGERIIVPGDKITNALRKLWDQGILADVEIGVSKIEGDRIFLEFILKERPRLQKFVFEGINKTERDNLTEKIKLIRGRVITDAMIKNAQLTVKKHFVDKGFLNVKVLVTEEEDSLFSNHAILRIKITKNKKVKINRIYFEDNEVVSARKLKSKLKTTNEKLRFNLYQLVVENVRKGSKENLGETLDHLKFTPNEFLDFMSDYIRINIFATSKFIKSSYEEDKDKVIAYYNTLGHRDAQIVEDTIYKHNDASIDIKIKVDEGNKYFFRNITWSGNYLYDNKILDRYLGIKKGDVYNQEELEKRLKYNPTGTDISSLYMDDGYLFFTIEPIEVKVEGDSIDIDMHIYEGIQTTISKIIITGNTQTNDHVILREIRTLPGQKFSRSLLIRTQREIAQLGYFDPEKIGINPVPNPRDGTVDIEYTLEEKPSDQIELSGGWGGGRGMGFVGTVGLVFNNFSIKKLPYPRQWHSVIPKGDGQRLALRVQASGARFQTYSFTFTEPWLGGRKPNSFTTNLSHSVQKDVDPRTLKTRGSLQISAITLGLGRRLKFPDDYFTLSNSITYQRYLMRDFPYGNFGFENETGLNNGEAHNINLNTTIARNSIDNPMFPRTGSTISLSATLTAPMSLLRYGSDTNYEALPYAEKYKWIEYHKWMFDLSQFIPIKGRLVLNARAHFGFLGRYNPNLKTSRFERFNLGGTGMTGTGFLLGTDIVGLRGYKDGSLDPENLENVNNPGGVTGSSPGVAFNKYVFELRFLVSPNPAATIYVHAFAEGGNNFGSLAEYNPFKLYRSTGVGARIFMPAFGLIGIDYGFGLDGTKFMRQGFMFTMGQQIR